MALRPVTEASEAATGGEGNPDNEGNPPVRMRSRPVGPRKQTKAQPKPMVGHPMSEFSYDKSFLTEGKDSPKIPDRLLPATADKPTSKKGKGAPPNLVVDTSKPTGVAPPPRTPATPISPMVLTVGNSARSRRNPTPPSPSKQFPTATTRDATNNVRRGSPGNQTHTGTHRDHKPEPIPIPKRATSVTWAEDTEEKTGRIMAKTPVPTKIQLTPEEPPRHKISRKPPPPLTPELRKLLNQKPAPSQMPKNAVISEVSTALLTSSRNVPPVQVLQPVQAVHTIIPVDRELGRSTGNKSWFSAVKKSGSKGNTKSAPRSMSADPVGKRIANGVTPTPKVERGRPTDPAPVSRAPPARSRSAGAAKALAKGIFGYARC